MKTIINAKNALYALFIIEILRQILFLIFSYSYSHINELISHIAMAFICLYLAYDKNEYITTKKQKIALYYLAFYHLFNKLIFPTLPFFNEDLMIEYINQIQLITTVIESISIILFVIAFLTLIWGFQIKTLYKKWITIFYFLPIINMGIWMLICPIINQIIIDKDLTRIKYLFETIFIQSISGIIAYSLMLWLIHKGYKIKNKIQ